MDGIPLSQSTFAADLLNPLRQDFIPALIAGQTDIAAQLFAAPTIETAEHTIYVLDAQTDDDLRSAAQLLKDKKLLAGSAGFAEFLAEAMSVFAPPTPLPALSLPMLVVNGSLHEVSLQQIAHAAQNGWAMFELAADVSPAQVVAALTIGQRALLTTSPRVVDDEFAARLAELVSQIFEQISVGTLFVFGGDTLAAIAEARGWTAFRPQTEFLPGMPLVEVCGQDALQLLTKAGGFGSVDLLAKI